MAKDMTKGNPGKTLFFFAVPMVLGNLFQQLYNIIDSIIVGNYAGSRCTGSRRCICFDYVSLCGDCHGTEHRLFGRDLPVFWGKTVWRNENSDPDSAFGLFCDRTVPDAGRDFRDGRDPAVYADPAENLFRCISLSENLFLRPLSFFSSTTC